ncbi:bacillithiol biosynthesis deacetylase BshB2 [Paenibacillus sp. N1-5-1-14]|nr:bacillithiol biosynthesis deacetylase BshB2 [Paenibacillus radicibacter]MCR8644633.1 bacillithiol biosynthesis deacetylase BshB2 [Paenibacillus radicibacter]
MERHILVVLAHPDDEAFGVSGFIALNTAQGVPVTYVCATLGEMGRNMGNPMIANRETMPALRLEELNEACAAIDLQDLRLLGYRDKTVEFESREEIADRIGQIIEETNPSLIVTFDSKHAVHPDHNAIGAATLLAVSRIPEEKRPTVYLKAFSKNCREEMGNPDIEIDVSAVLDKKLNSLRAHASQTASMIREAEVDRNPGVLAYLSKEVYWTYRH